jgi:hypothetical protein
MWIQGGQEYMDSLSLYSPAQVETDRLEDIGLALNTSGSPGYFAEKR